MSDGNHERRSAYTVVPTERFYSTLLHPRFFRRAATKHAHAHVTRQKLFRNPYSRRRRGERRRGLVTKPPEMNRREPFQKRYHARDVKRRGIHRGLRHGERPIQ